MKAMTYSEKLEKEITALESEIQRQHDVMFFLVIYASSATTVLACLLAYNLL